MTKRVELGARVTAVAILLFAAGSKVVWPASTPPVAPTWLTTPIELGLAAWLGSARFPRASSIVTFILALGVIAFRLTYLTGERVRCGCLGDLHTSASVATMMMVALLLCAALCFPSSTASAAASRL